MSRPWRSMAFVPSESIAASADRLLSDPIPAGILERRFEYRLVFDPDREAWRVDRRSHVQGG